MKTLNHRKDIDGLRGISIILVLLFHLDFSGFEGGYIGVDIFFLISGYLITSIILTKFNKNEFNILEFYVNRFRRIFPVLFLVILLSIICSFFFFNAEEIKEFNLSALSSLVFFSNFKYIFNQIDYFTSSIEEPLLNTWILYIEAQFYFFFPLLFIFFKNKLIYIIIFAILIISFLLAQLGGNLSFKPPFLDNTIKFFSPMQFNFYQTPTRVWEILIGSILAFKINELKKISLGNNFSMIGIFLLILSLLLYPSINIGHPGIYTLIPIMGTILIIIDHNEKTIIYKLLTNKYLVFVGLISYSLYLFHYPIIIYYKIFNIYPIFIFDKIIIIILSLVASVISWKYFEKPIRNKKNISNTYLVKFVTIAFCFIIILFLFINNYIIKFEYFTKFQKIYDYSLDFDPKRSVCANGPVNSRKYKFNIIDSCVLGAKNIAPDTVLIGDSMAASLALGLEQLYHKNNKSFIQLTYNGCIPVEDKFLWEKNSRFDCEKYFNEVLNILLTNKNIKNVIFLANLPLYFEGNSYGTKKKLPTLKDYPIGIKRTQELEKQLINYFNKILELNHNIVLIKTIPEPGLYVPKSIARAKKFKKNKIEYSSTYKNYLKRTQSSSNFFNIIGQNKIVKIVNSTNQLCNINMDKCYWTINEKPIYHDHLHFSSHGSKFFVNKNTQILLFNSNN